MVRALRASFARYARGPRIYTTVPGQSSEWFDGDSLVNRGMRLSPWEAPRFLWAAVEGICGVVLRPDPEPPKVQPLLPLEWKWIGLRNLAYHGRRISYFGARVGTPGPGAAEAEAQQHMHQSAVLDMQLYANLAIQLAEGHAVAPYTEASTARIRVHNDALRALPFARPDQVLACIAV